MLFCCLAHRPQRACSHGWGSYQTPPYSPPAIPQIRGPAITGMAGTSAEGRGGPHNTHEEHEGFLSHTAEKFHLKKSAGSITRKTVRCIDVQRARRGCYRPSTFTRKLGPATLVCSEQAENRCSFQLSSISQRLFTASMWLRRPSEPMQRHLVYWTCAASIWPLFAIHYSTSSHNSLI